MESKIEPILLLACVPEEVVPGLLGSVVETLLPTATRDMVMNRLLVLLRQLIGI